MTDEEVERLWPVVDDFITAVANENALRIATILGTYSVNAIAVMVASSGLEQVARLREEAKTAIGASQEQLGEAQAEASRLAVEVVDLKLRVRELRAWVDAQVAVIAQKDKEIKVLKERQAA